MSDDKTLAERAALAMGIAHDVFDDETVRLKSDTKIGRWFDPEHDANDALEFAEWAEQDGNGDICWGRKLDGTVVAIQRESILLSQWHEGHGAFPAALTRAILAALEVDDAE